MIVNGVIVNEIDEIEKSIKRAKLIFEVDMVHYNTLPVSIYELNKAKNNIEQLIKKLEEKPITIPVNRNELPPDVKHRTLHVTTDPTDERLGRGFDNVEGEQHEVYLILSEEERAKGFVRPYRESYIHDICGGLTRMGMPIAETYARDPKFYSATYCIHCRKHLPVSEFTWDGTNIKVGE